MKELAGYRFARAQETLIVAEELLCKECYKDANNRSYYAAFYAMKAVYALKGEDFKKHKVLMANFNKEFVATEIFPRTLGKRISAMAIVREQSDYNDFYVASKEECKIQVDTAKEIIYYVMKYLNEFGVRTESV